MRSRLIIPHLRRHAMLIGVILAIFGLAAITIALRYDSIQVLFTHGETKLNIEATRR